MRENLSSVNQEWLDSFRKEWDGSVEGKQRATVSGGDKVRLKGGERRYVTAMHLDLKGYTSLSEKLDHEVVADMMDGLFDSIKRRIDAYGGWIEKLEGDAILAAFGSMKAHEDDAVRAVEAALSIQESLSRVSSLLRERGFDILIRIGIHSGEVTRTRRSGYDVITGDTVNTAARIEQNSEPGATVISDEVMKLTGGFFRYGECEEIKAKGKKAPIKVYPVKGHAVRRERWERSFLSARTGFIGRKAELNRLRELYDGSSESCIRTEEDKQRRTHDIVVAGIEGPAGMGKSRLVDEFLLRLKTEKETKNTGNKIPVFKGFARSYASRPFEIFISLIMDFLGLSSFSVDVQKRLEEMIDKIPASYEKKDELRKALPMLGYLIGIRYDDPRFGLLDPQNLQTEIFIALRHLIEEFIVHQRQKQQNTVILVFEDFHWADESSRKAFSFLLKNMQPKCPLMILTVYRPEGPPGLPTIGNFEFFHIRPSGFSKEDETALIEGMLGEKTVLPQKLKNLINQKGAGNPYYIEELVHHMVDKNIIKQTGEKWRFTGDFSAAGIPVTLRGLIQARIDSLKSDSKRVIQNASVIGSEFFFDTLKRVMDRLEEKLNLEYSLNELAELSFISGDEEVALVVDETGIGDKDDDEAPGSSRKFYAFKHVLTRDVAYESLRLSDRRILHQLCAEVIEEKYASNLSNFHTILAEHWEMCGNLEKAVDYYWKVGKKAAETFDNEQALKAYTKIIEFMSDDEIHADFISKVLEKRGIIFKLIGQMDMAEKDFHRGLLLAGKYNDKAREAAFLLRIGKIDFDRGHYDSAFNKYKSASDYSRLSFDFFLEALSQLNIGLSLMAKGEYEEAEKWIMQARRTAQKKENMEVEMLALDSLGRLYYTKADFDDSADCYRQSIELSRELGDRRSESASMTNLAGVFLEKKKYEKAKFYLEQALKIVQETGDRKTECATYNNMANIHIHMKQYDEALELYRRSAQVASKIGNKHAESTILFNTAYISRKLGRYEVSLTMLKTVRTLTGEMNAVYLETAALLNMGYAYSDLYCFEQARENFESVIRISREKGMKKIESEALTNMALIHLTLENLDGAMKYIDEALKVQTSEKDEAIFSLSLKARILFSYGQIKKAEELSLKAVKRYEKIVSESGKTGIDDKQIPFTHYLILKAKKDKRAAEYLEKAYRLMQRSIETIASKADRRNLKNNFKNKPIVQEWKKMHPIESS